jgi:hypothetical protein
MCRADLFEALGQFAADNRLTVGPRIRPCRPTRRQPFRAFIEDQRGLHTGKARNNTRADLVAGGKPAKRKRSEGRPDTVRAQIAAQGPGAAVIGNPLPPPRAQVQTPGPRSAASPPRTRRRGFSAFCHQGDQPLGLPLAAVVVIGDQRAACPRGCRGFPSGGFSVRVSSATSTSAPARTSSARSVMSRAAPIGVDTKCRPGGMARSGPGLAGESGVSDVCLTSLLPFPNPLPWTRNRSRAATVRNHHVVRYSSGPQVAGSGAVLPCGAMVLSACVPTTGLGTGPGGGAGRCR